MLSILFVLFISNRLYLLYMRGTGEPVFENDFPSGSAIAETIHDGSKAAERNAIRAFQSSRISSSNLIDI